MSTETVPLANPEWDFGDRIRKVRRSIAQIDQEEMADAIGVSRQVYAAWEAGRTKPTDIVAIAKRIAEQFPGRVTASWLLGVGDDSPPTPYRGRPSPLATRRSKHRKASPQNPDDGNNQPVGEPTAAPLAA